MWGTSLKGIPKCNGVETKRTEDDALWAVQEGEETSFLTRYSKSSRSPCCTWAVGSGPFCHCCPAWAGPGLHTSGGDQRSPPLPKHCPVTSSFSTSQTSCLKCWKETHANNEIHKTLTDKTKESKLDLMVHNEVPKVLTADRKQYPPIFSHLYLEWIWQLVVISLCQNKPSVKYFTGTPGILAKALLFVQFIWGRNFHFIRWCYKVRWKKITLDFYFGFLIQENNKSSHRIKEM